MQLFVLLNKYFKVFHSFLSVIKTSLQNVAPIFYYKYKLCTQVSFHKLNTNTKTDLLIVHKKIILSACTVVLWWGFILNKLLLHASSAELQSMEDSEAPEISAKHIFVI